MANTLIHETRRLQFPLDTLVDALIELENKLGHWPPKATVVGATVDQSNGTAADGVVLSIHRPEDGKVIERRYSLPMIAAAMVNYCLVLRVPIPRKSSKSIQILPDSLALVLENTVILQSRHEELSTLPAGSVKPSATVPAASEASQTSAAGTPAKIRPTAEIPPAAEAPPPPEAGPAGEASATPENPPTPQSPPTPEARDEVLGSS